MNVDDIIYCIIYYILYCVIYIMIIYCTINNRIITVKKYH